MPITVHYRVKCDKCGNWLGTGVPGYPATATNSDDSPLFRTSHDATAHAVARGWSAYPVLCPDCAARAKEATVTNKIAGLYLNLAKALNALEEAGEAPITETDLTVDGLSGKVIRSEDRWTVVQA